MAAGKIQNKIESQRETQVNLGRVRFRLTDSGLFESVWTFPGAPQLPISAEAVEKAAASLPHAHAVQVGRVWGAVRNMNSGLGVKLYGADTTHQSKVGEYLNALVYTRFFSAKSVQGVKFLPAVVASQLAAGELEILKSAVDAHVTIFYLPPGVRSPSLASVPVSVVTNVGSAVVINDKDVSVVRNAPFRQVNLTSSVTASSGKTIVWSTLELDKSQFNGQSAVVSNVDSSTVNLNYANGYIGSDIIRWRVKDSSDAWSAWANININIIAP
jgi:hypothetical protein